jgi:ferredoxin-NADP reductase
MAGAALPGRLNWLIAKAGEIVDETDRVRSIVLDCPGWPGHLPGQHIDIRLTAEDGYQAQRSYSISAPADGEQVVITVEVVDDGEVSPFLVEELRVGDQIEIRGPIGGYFVWEPSRGGPVQLLGGGSGVAPLMAMLRERVRSGSDVPVRYLSSARSYDDLIFRQELESITSEAEEVEVLHTLTRSQPPKWTGLTGRVNRVMLAQHVWPAFTRPLCYVCGPTGFVETVASALVALGHQPGRIKTERFGPTS